MIRKRPGVQRSRQRRAITEAVLGGEVSTCFLPTGQQKVIYPTEELAAKAAKRLNKLPSLRGEGEPYQCDRGDHWHLRTIRPGRNSES